MFSITLFTFDDLVGTTFLTGIHKGRFERCVDPRLSYRTPIGNVCIRGRCTVDSVGDRARSGRS